MARYQHKPKKAKANNSQTRASKPSKPGKSWSEKWKTALNTKWGGWLTLILLFVVIGILYIPDNKSSDYNRHSAQVTSIKPLIENKQGKKGSETIVTGYKIEYKYVLDSRVYESEKTLSPDYQEFVRYLNKLDKENRKIEVLYKKDNNGESKINTDLGSAFYRRRQ